MSNIFNSFATQPVSEPKVEELVSSDPIAFDDGDGVDNKSAETLDIEALNAFTIPKQKKKLGLLRNVLMRIS